MKSGITDWEDYLVFGIYFLIVIVVGLLSMVRKNRESLQGYFLAGRSMTWIPIGASLFASNIGSEHFVGLAGSGAASGIGVVLFEWGAVILLVLLGWIFLPIYLTAQVFTMPEYLGRRFGGNRMRVYLSCVALLLYIVAKISVDMYAGVFFIQVATGLDMYVAMIPLMCVTAVYTIAGGLAAVVFTDTLQTVVMLVGAVILAIMAFVKVGGIGALYVKYFEAIPPVPGIEATSNTTTLFQYAANYSVFDNATYDNSSIYRCGLPNEDAFHIFRDASGSDLPWPGVVFRATFASLWNWCADQVIVQRALAAKSMAHARGATILAGYLKFSPMFLIIMPGMISRILYPGEIACVGKEACKAACDNEAGCSNLAYPLLILNLAPIGMRGLLMAVMIAALMSSLTSIFNSAVTVFTMDLWTRARPKAKERELLVVGRLFVVVLVGISIAFMPLIMHSHDGQLFMYIQAVTGYIAPPISAIFLLAIFIPRINEKGAFWGVMCGQCVGLTRLVLDFIYGSPKCGHPDDRPSIVADVHFSYFSIIVFMVTTIVAIVVSLVTTAQPLKDMQNLTFWTLDPTSRSKDKGSHGHFKTLVENKGSSADTMQLEKCRNLHDLMQTKTPFKNPKDSDDPNQWRVAFHRFKTTNSPVTSSDPEQYQLTVTDEPASRAQVIRDIGTDFESESETDKPVQKTFSREVKSPWSWLLNVNAAILLCVLVFLCGFFH